MKPATNLKQGLKLSRSYDTRNMQETKLLYTLLQDAAVVVKTGNDKEIQEALDFLVKMFEPYIVKVSQKIKDSVGNAEDFADILQDTYMKFIELTYSYDENKSTYAYFIRNMLYTHMRAFAKKHYYNKETSVDTAIIEESVSDKHLKSSDIVYDNFNGYILYDEYEDFILNRSKKKSKTTTVKEVCYRYFLGGETCSNIANDLGVTYHAIYSVIGKIKKELRYFFDKNKFTDMTYNDSDLLD